MSIVEQGEKIRGLETRSGIGYVEDLISTARENYLQNYLGKAKQVQIENLPWDDVYVAQLEAQNEKLEKANFMAIKFLVWFQESLDNLDGKSTYIPVDDDFFKSVNDRFRKHLINFINYRNGNDDLKPSEIKWQEIQRESNMPEIIGWIGDPDSQSATAISCEYIFNDMSNQICGVSYSFNYMD